MKSLHFEIPYHTAWGECLRLAYSLDGSEVKYALLETADGYKWHAKLVIPDRAESIRYAYEVVESETGAILRTEQASWRIFRFNKRLKVYFLDVWATHTLPTFYGRTAFEQCVMLPRGGEKLHLSQLEAPYLLLLHAAPVQDGRRWAVVGSTSAWGKWDIRQARQLQRTGTYEYALTLREQDIQQGVEYKYVLIDPLNPEKATWETGENRKIEPHVISKGETFVRQDDLPLVPDCKPWRGAGVVIPLFSLRSEGSWGVGDFGDLMTLTRWASEAGMRAVQLLPINDTTRDGSWHDSYPYNAISVFALHPIYLDPRPWRNTLAYTHAEEQGKELNQLPTLDYERVMKLKMAFLHELFDEMGEKVMRNESYKAFYQENTSWLTPYTSFAIRRDYYGTANFREWTKIAEKVSLNEVDAECGAAFYCFVQFLLHQQMSEAHAQARELGVILKGDIPIGVSMDSVPAWQDAHLFHFTGTAGAPPDAFATHGQNWGFPTYNWDEMAKDGYAWWRRRLAHMACYFDAYRIDHVLGFFRIWEVPTKHIDGVLGHFRPALPFSEAELHDFGFKEVRKYAQPFVSARYMEQLRSEYGEERLVPFFTPYYDGYTLCPPYNEQRYVARNVQDGSLQRMLMDIAAERLFLADEEREGMFHPRVSAQLTHVFSELTADNREAFNRLHDNFFYVRHNDFWRDEALRKLPAVTNSISQRAAETHLYAEKGEGMLPCAEDLGMVPGCVKGVLEQLSILSLEIQNMPKAYGVRFGNPATYPYLSVATIATHDMPPFRLWWEKNEQDREIFWHDVLHLQGEAPATAEDWICEEVVKAHLKSPAMLCLLSLQDWLAISPTLRNPHPETEQINVPANPNQYWQYRMHITLEKLVAASDFSEKLRGLIGSC